MKIPNQQVYQMWSSVGEYLGVLQGVTSVFKRVQDINTAGPSTVKIKVSMKLDTASQPVKAITTEDGLWITTEDGKGLTTEGEQPNFGVDKSKIRNGNIVKIIEISDYHPNGQVVFTGKVKKWNVNFGTEDDATLYVRPLSDDMNNKLVKSGEVLGFSLTSQNKSYPVYGGSPLSANKFAYQLASPAQGIQGFSSIDLYMSAQNASAPSTVTVRIYQTYSDNPASGETANLAIMNNPANAHATAVGVISGTSPQVYHFTFDKPLYMKTTTFYTVEVEATGASGSGANIYYTSVNSYDSGIILTSNSGNASGWQLGTPSDFNDLNGELYFRQYYIPPFTKATITNFEPSELLKTIISNYNSEDGIVTYTPTSIESTGIIIPTYTFQSNTVAEALDILLSLSPAGFYYSVDPGTNVLTFKRVHTTADHVLIFKTHIENLDLSASIEQLKNDVFFTGGLSGATNLFIERKNQTSINNFGVELDRIGDIKVTNTSVANSIASNHLDRYDDEVYESIVSLVSGMTDITKYQLGETIGFANFSSFPDTVIIPIVRVSRDMEIGEFSIGALPLRQSDLVQASQDELLAIQTVDNPTQPS